MDQITGVSSKRPGLETLNEVLRKGDTLVVWRLDRLGRSLKHLMQFVKELEEKGIAFKSIQETIDTSSSTGKLVFHIFGALAEFERNLIRERTNAGLVAAKLHNINYRNDFEDQEYICHIGSRCEVYRLPFIDANYCILTSIELFDTLDIKKIAENQFFEVKFIPDENNENKGKLQFQYWMEVILLKNADCYRLELEID